MGVTVARPAWPQRIEKGQTAEQRAMAEVLACGWSVLPKMSRSCTTGNSGSRTIRPFTDTRPSRTQGAACVRDVKPCLDKIRATPKRFSGLSFIIIG